MNKREDSVTNVSQVAEPSTKKQRKKRKAKSQQPLLFIDTNILLDFYRTRNDAGISLLSKIDKLHDRTITTCQVEMEFKKNRQKVINESFALLKPPDFNLVTPAFLSEAQAVSVIKKKVQEVKKQVETLKRRILSTLENPKTYDRIYQTAQRLFINPGSLNLRHDSPEYKQVWRRALRRFLEGRPPRKKEDTSAGDSINWEWIVHCIKVTNRDVIIVSRDADYGLTLDGKGYANNWLTDEVKERVNQKRKLILVDRLSAALKLMDVKVTREELTSERAIIKVPARHHEDEIDDLVSEALGDLVNREEIGDLIALTNACGWYCDGYDIGEAKYKDGTWVADVTFSFSGDQDEDKSWHGSEITGKCVVQIYEDKSVSISEIEACLETCDDVPEGWEDDLGAVEESEESTDGHGFQS